MIAKSDLSTIAIINTNSIDVDLHSSNKYYNLPTDKLLSVTYNTGRDGQITLKTYQFNDLEKCLSHLSIDTNNGNAQVLCILPNGEILVQAYFSSIKQFLYKICPDTLGILSSQPWKSSRISWDNIGVIDNEHFFAIRNKNLTNGQATESECELTCYTWTPFF